MLWGEMTEDEIEKRCKRLEEMFNIKRTISIMDLIPHFRAGWLAKDIDGWCWFVKKPKYSKKDKHWKSDGWSFALDFMINLDKDSIQPEESLIKI